MTALFPSRDRARGRRRRWGLATLCIAVLAAASSRAAVVEIAVTGVVEARGHVHVDLHGLDVSEAGLPLREAPQATPGRTLVRIAGVQPGE